MKKFLSMLLVLAMVLTMASFPAFAASTDPVIVPLAVQSPFGDDGNVIENAIDTNWGNHHRPAGTYPTNSTKGADGNWYFIVDLGNPYNISSFRVKWSTNFTTAAALYGSNDLNSGEWTEIADLTFAAQETTNDIVHSSEYRYIKIESYKLNASNPAVFNVEFRGTSSYKIDATVLKASTNADAVKTAPNLIDGDTSTYYYVPAWLEGDKGDGTKAQGYPANWTSASNTLIFDLGELYDVDGLNIWWGAQGGVWGKNIADAYEVYYSADNVTYTPALSYSGLADIVQGGTNNYTDFDTRLIMTRIGWASTIAEKNSYSYGYVIETNLDWKQIRYVKIVMTRAIINPTVAEVEIFKEAVFGEKVPTTYTVNYVDEEGNALADSITVNGSVGDKAAVTAVDVVGYKPDADKKTITLAESGNVITFVYAKKPAATYTVKYVDENGNSLADNKVVSSYGGDEASESPVNLYKNGYFTTDAKKTITLNAGDDNEFVFTYFKVIPVKKGTFDKLTSKNWWNTTFIVNGDISGTASTLDDTGATNPVAEMKFEFDKLYSFDKMTVYVNKSTASAKIYVSNDGETWSEPVHEGAMTGAKLDTRSIYAYEVDLEGVEAQYIKYEVLGNTYPSFNEIIFEGEPAYPEIALTGANVVKNSGFGATVANEGKDGSLDSTFDGKDATTANSNWINVWFGENVQDVINGVDGKGKPWSEYSLTIDLGAIYDIRYLDLQAGVDGWGTPAPVGYDIYVAGNDGEFRLAESFVDEKYNIGDKLISYTTKNTHNLEEDDVRYVKVLITRASGRTPIGEIDIFGKKVADIETEVPATYTVKYVDENGDEIADATTGEGIVGEDVTVEAVAVEGYTATVASKTVTLVDGTNEIVFTYTKDPVAATYTVKYVDVNGNEIADADVVTGKFVGDEVTATAKEIEGYVLGSEATKTITLVEGENTIVFEYARLVVVYSASYCDENGNTLADTTYGSGYYGDEVTIEAAVIPGYTATEASKTITLLADANEVKFTYTKDPVAATYTVKYVDADGNEIAPAKTVDTKFVGDEVKEFAVVVDNYAADASAKTITLVEGINEIVFTYTKTKMQSLGGTIRIPTADRTAGLRFGAQLEKSALGEELAGKSYNYAQFEKAGVKVGFFMLPVEMLGEYDTLADYHKNGGANVLDVPAVLLAKETNEIIEFTAVLTEIPTSEYNTRIVAVPYVCIDGEYSYYTEMTKTYNGVATAIADAYDRGDVRLTPEEIDYIETLLDRVLVK